MYHQFDVVLSSFPFADMDISKVRPAIILSADKYSNKSGLYVCCMVTSTKKSNYELDSDIDDVEIAGLMVKSKARPEKIFTVHETAIYSKIGKLSVYDRELLIENLSLLVPLNYGRGNYLHEKQSKFRSKKYK